MDHSIRDMRVEQDGAGVGIGAGDDDEDDENSSQGFSRSSTSMRKNQS